MRTPTAASSRTADPRLRGSLLMPLCALVTHQLRYQLAFGSHASARLSRDGHSYLISLEPFVLLAAALAVGGFLGAIARGSRGRTGHPLRLRSMRLAAVCAVALLAIYCAQELFEGFFAVGHPPGLVGVFGHGGWLAVPISLVLGALLAVALSVADAVIRRLGRRAAGSRRRTFPSAPRPPRLARPAWRLDPISGLAPALPPPLAAG